MGLVVSQVATALALTQILRQALGGPATPSRHMTAVTAVIAPLAKSLGHRLSGDKATSPQGAKDKEAMEIDDNDFRHLSYGLELDYIEDDQPNSAIVPDDHDLVSEGDETQKDLPYRSTIEHVSATPAKKARKCSNTNRGSIEIPQPLASWLWPLLSPLLIQNLHPNCVFICVAVCLCSYVPHIHLFD